MTLTPSQRRCDLTAAAGAAGLLLLLPAVLHVLTSCRHGPSVLRQQVNLAEHMFTTGAKTMDNVGFIEILSTMLQWEW